MRTFARALLVAGLLTTACGGPSARRVSGDAAATATPSIPPELAAALAAAGTPPPPPVPTLPAAARATAAPGSTPVPTEKGMPDLKPGESKKIWGEMAMDLDVKPACAIVGTVMKAVIRTEPDASIGGAVQYSDNNPHEDFTYAPHHPTGEHVWTWTIKPVVPKGKATVMVTAGKARHPSEPQRGAGAAAAFMVAERC